jgi:hypothetical protein
MEEDCTYWLCIVSPTTWVLHLTESRSRFGRWIGCKSQLEEGLQCSGFAKSLELAASLWWAGPTENFICSWLDPDERSDTPTFFFGSVLSTIPHVALAPFQFRYLPAIFFCSSAADKGISFVCLVLTLMIYAWVIAMIRCMDFGCSIWFCACLIKPVFLQHPKPLPIGCRLRCWEEVDSLVQRFARLLSLRASRLWA